MVWPPIHWFSGIAGRRDDLPDHFEEIVKFEGSAVQAGVMLLGVNDGDTVLVLRHTADITDTQLRSIHETNDSTSYQNTSGKDAFVILVVVARGAGSATRAFKIYSSPNDNSKTSATEVYEFPSGAAGMTVSLNQFTTPPLKIQNNHFCVIENNSGDGTSDIDCAENCRVVERI